MSKPVRLISIRHRPFPRSIKSQFSGNSHIDVVGGHTITMRSVAFIERPSLQPTPSTATTQQCLSFKTHRRRQCRTTTRQLTCSRSAVHPGLRLADEGLPWMDLPVRSSLSYDGQLTMTSFPFNVHLHIYQCFLAACVRGWLACWI
jgi:hypothetical protein